MNKKITTLIIGVFCVLLVKPQQLPQMTQYMINNYAINPAIAGMDDYFQANTIIRNQWTGITNHPRLTMLSIYGKRSENVGLGGNIFNDQIGHTSRVGASLSYTYHFPISNNINMAFSLSAGGTQFSIDKQGWTLLDPDDPFLQGNKITRFVPDATFGFNTYGKNWYIGASIPQLLANKINLLDDDFYTDYNQESKGNLYRHYFLLGAFEHSFNLTWDLEPSVLVKSVDGAPLQIDCGLKTTYNKNLWLGINYRNNSELAVFTGYSIQDRYVIGYSYDMMGDLGASHEFMLGIRFNSLEESEIIKE